MDRPTDPQSADFGPVRDVGLPVEIEPGPLMLSLLELTGDGSHEDPLSPREADARMLDARRRGWDALPTRVKVQVRNAIGNRVEKDQFDSTLGRIGFKTKTWELPAEDVLPDGEADDQWHGLDEALDTGGEWDAIASGLAWRRRVATIGGFAKAGKTTTLAGAAAGIAYGVDWLSGDVRAPGRVLWLGAPGESPREEIRHLLVKAGLPPEPETLQRVVFQPVRQIDDVVAKLERLPIDGLELVVVDSLRGLLSASGVDENDSGAVRGILGKLAGLAERWDCAVDVVHHFRRDKEARRGDRMRGSGDILAGVDVTVEFDRTNDGASLTYSGREGAPVDDLFLDWHGGRYSVAAGPSSPVGPGGGGGGGSKGWTEEHREFVMAWRGEHPDGSALKCYQAMVKAGIGIQKKSFYDHFKMVPGTTGTTGTTGTKTPAEGGSVVPDPREGTTEPPVAHGTGAVPGVVPDLEPAPVEGGALEPGAGDWSGARVTISRGQTMDMDQVRRDTEEIVADFVAGGERAESRMRSNTMRALDQIPGWEERAEALGLDGDVMKWSDADWLALDPYPGAVTRGAAA